MTETLPRTRGDRYALAALKNRRSSLASEIEQLERQIRHRRDLLVHVDATLKLLDPSIEVDAIPTKRPQKRIKLFRQGELGRTIIDIIRRSPDGSASSAEITTELLAIGGHGEEARRTVAQRVRGNLAYLHRCSRVGRAGNGPDGRWIIK